MAREFMAKIEALCFEMNMVFFNELTFIINRDLDGKGYDEEKPIVQDVSSTSKTQTGQDKELTIRDAVLMADRRAAIMEGWIKEWLEALSEQELQALIVVLVGKANPAKEVYISFLLAKYDNDQLIEALRDIG